MDLRSPHTTYSSQSLTIDRGSNPRLRPFSTAYNSSSIATDRGSDPRMLSPPTTQSSPSNTTDRGTIPRMRTPTSYGSSSIIANRALDPRIRSPATTYHTSPYAKKQPPNPRNTPCSRCRSRKRGVSYMDIHDNYSAYTSQFKCPLEPGAPEGIPCQTCIDEKKECHGPQLTEKKMMKKTEKETPCVPAGSRDVAVPYPTLTGDAMVSSPRYSITWRYILIYYTYGQLSSSSKDCLYTITVRHSITAMSTYALFFLIDILLLLLNFYLGSC